MSDGSSAPRLPRDGVVAPADLESLTDELLPALITRLRASRLGELEVAGEGWRVRLRRDTSVTQRHAGSSAARGAGSAGSQDDRSQDDLGSVARSPGVGYFKPASGLSVGRTVQVGDLLGSVDVLGIVLDVTAPGEGFVSQILAEGGQAVEYGQALAEIDVFEGDLAADAHASAGAAE